MDNFDISLLYSDIPQIRKLAESCVEIFVINSISDKDETTTLDYNSLDCFLHKYIKFVSSSVYIKRDYVKQNRWDVFNRAVGILTSNILKKLEKIDTDLLCINFYCSYISTSLSMDDKFKITADIFFE